MGIYEHQRALLALYREILTERQFEMIRMHDVDGMSGRQIADVYGLGRSSVCRIMKEARLAIRNAARRRSPPPWCGQTCRSGAARRSAPWRNWKRRWRYSHRKETEESAWELSGSE